MNGQYVELHVSPCRADARSMNKSMHNLRLRLTVARHNVGPKHT